MRVYLDNCCYNRPFDRCASVVVKIEAIAKLEVQALMRVGIIEYVWSDMLTREVGCNPFGDHKRAIMGWIAGAAENVVLTDDVLARGVEIQALGIKPKDAIHLASAEKAGCDWFLTTDKGILRKVRELGTLRVANPVEFIVRKDDNA